MKSDTSVSVLVGRDERVGDAGDLVLSNDSRTQGCVHLCRRRQEVPGGTKWRLSDLDLLLIRARLNG